MSFADVVAAIADAGGAWLSVRSGRAGMRVRAWVAGDSVDTVRAAAGDMLIAVWGHDRRFNGDTIRGYQVTVLVPNEVIEAAQRFTSRLRILEGGT